MKSTRSAAELDRAHVIHHMAPRRDGSAPPPTIMVHGSGLRLRDSLGRGYLDAVSGMFNVNIGYGRAEIADVAARDISRLGFAPLFDHLGNEPAARLAAKLSSIAPPGIHHWFFTTGGSDAVDSTLKFVRSYHSLLGRPERTVVLARRRSYHGMSFGALSVTGQSRYKEHFGPMLPSVAHFGQPDEADGTPEALDAQIRYIGAESVAAVLLEPLSLTAGVIPAPDGYLRAIAEVCQHHEVLLAVDEVVTGFGRTGAMLACEAGGVSPDVIVLAKGLTSGYLPLGAVGISPRLHDAIVRREQPLLNGFSAGGHPTSCAVAMANIDIIERENLVDRGIELGAQLRELIAEAHSRNPDIGLARGSGLLLATDIGPEDDEGLASATAERLRSSRVLVRRYGRAIVLGPALVATDRDLEEIVARLASAVRAARG